MTESPEQTPAGEGATEDQAEPSMEEILASIRRIISEDEEAGEGEKPSDAATEEAASAETSESEEEAASAETSEEEAASAETDEEETAAAESEEEGDEADVHQVKADHQEVIHRVGKLGVPPEDIDQEHPPVPVQGSSHPDGQADADEQVRGVRNHLGIHGDLLFLNVFSTQVWHEWGGGATGF